MDLHAIHRIAPISGFGLSIEEFSGLEVATAVRKLEENLVGKMQFWGKIFGTTQDYLIIYHVDPFAEFPDKKYYYCIPSDYVLRAMPIITEDYAALASKITAAFTGDPSFFAYNGEEEEPEPEDPDAPPVERFRELHRLVYVIKKIDNECAIVPRGALAVDTGKKVLVNNSYQGLSYETSLELRAYLHMRRPENLQSIALWKRPGIIKSDDFLDCIDKDLPREMWSISHDNSASTAFVRNLFWDGFGFYSVLKTAEHGYAYFGNGVPNYDIAFMM